MPPKGTDEWMKAFSDLHRVSGSNWKGTCTFCDLGWLSGSSTRFIDHLLGVKGHGNACTLSKCAHNAELKAKRRPQ
jgi:hypothetical protein